MSVNGVEMPPNAAATSDGISELVRGVQPNSAIVTQDFRNQDIAVYQIVNPTESELVIR